MGKLRRAIGLAKYCRFWKRGHSRYLLAQRIHRNKNSERRFSDHDHMLAAAAWLARAQDATVDGGVVGHYRLNVGWSQSHALSTGDAISTYLDLSVELDTPRFKERARRAVEFLLAIQHGNGAFPDLEIVGSQDEPAPFATAEIINGLIAWARATGDHIAIEAAKRAGDWLISVQDGDGGWRKSHFSTVSTSSSHIAGWLAQLGQYTGERKYLEAASRTIDWALINRVPETGWIELMGTDADQQEGRIASTHSIAYTLWGILYTSEILGRQDGITAVAKAAAKIARRLELSRWLPGMLDWRWKGAADYACLTGNAQMALIWFRLYERVGGIHFVNAGLKAIDLIKARQPMDNPNPALRGGIAGSDPLWGDYIFAGVPSWAAKYFIDALIEKKKLLTLLETRKKGLWKTPKNIPHGVPDIGPDEKILFRPKIAMLAHEGATKIARMTEAWAPWGFKPDLVIIERQPEVSFRRKLGQLIGEGGFSGLAALLPEKRAKAKSVSPAKPLKGPEKPPVKTYVGPATYCTARGIDFMMVDSINSAAAYQSLKALKTDIVIHADAGIVMAELLAIPRLGVIKAHMGILPYYRGLNVAEWAAFNGDPLGASVHLIGPGIDSGPIICIKNINAAAITDIQGLQAALDQTQIELLGEVMHYIVETAKLPPLRAQKPDEGHQFFSIHPDLARLIFAKVNNPG